MDEKLKKITEKIDKKIAKKTGLNSKEDIEVYSFFCHHADSKNGIVLYGDVTHDIYQTLVSKASEPMKVLEEAYWESIGNHEGVPYPLEARHFDSPLSRKAKDIYGTYIASFLQSGLVDMTQNKVTGEVYPVLKGYNYLNDSTFYRKIKSKNSTGRELKL
jgi:hypothetical protein